MERAETIIVGGGPAGISTALFLTHATGGRGSVVVLEREHYPREKFCAGAIGARADKLLGTIGVAVDVPSVPLSGVAFRAGEETLVVREGDVGRVVRRIEFDHALARAAMERGIRVIQGARVGSVRLSDRRFELDTTRGTFVSRVLVGADGVESVVRRALGFEASPFRAQALEVDTEPVASDLPRDVLLFDASHRELPGYYWDFPTIVDGRELMCRGVYALRTAAEQRRVDVQGLLERELAARGLSLAGLRKKRFAERGFELHAPHSRPGVLLVGEAAGIDPVTGEGIAQAIQYGAVAGRYLARKLGERDLAFTDWAREIKSTMIGRDLWVRTLGAPLFYGPPRPRIERFVLQNPSFVRVGLQHFAGKPWSKRHLLRATVAALAHTAFGGAHRDPATEPAPAEGPPAE